MPTSIANGILYPALQNRFIVRIENTSDEFQQQFVGFAMNLVKKQILVIVEQSLTAQVKEHIVIQDIINDPKKRLVTLEIIDNQTNVVDTIKFHSCAVTDHQIVFDYTSNNPAWHEVEFSYDSLTFGNGSGQTAYNAAMSIIGKP